MKRTLLVLAAAALAAVSSASAGVIPTAHGSAVLEISHAHFGCHTWGRAGMYVGTAHTIVVQVGHPLSIVNRDSADHTLVQTSGPVALAPTLLTRGAAIAMTFFTPGTYTFQTRESPHTLSMRDSIGDPKDVPDSELTVKLVVVSEYE